MEDSYLETENNVSTAKTTSVTDTTEELSLVDAEGTLALLKTGKDCNKRGKWSEMPALQLQETLSSTDGLKTFLYAELRVIVRYLKRRKD